MSTPDVRFLLTMFLPQANVRVQDQKKRCRSQDGGMMHWWPLESQHVIAIMNQHHRHHLAQRFVRPRFQKASEQFPTKAFSIIHDVWWFFMTYDMKTHETSGFNVELNNIQNIMAHSCTLYIYIFIMCSIYLLTCSNVGPLEDACAWPGGPVRKRQRVDSEAETHVKKLRAWANEWPIPGRAVGNLTVFFDR